MINPSTSQTMKRTHVITVRPVIRPPQRMIEIKGNHGTSGTLKTRGRSGCVLRKMITPSDTKTKANNVPMLERSAASLMAKIPDGMPTASPAIQVDQCGVLNLGCTAEKNFGNSPSRDIAYQMRACPYWNTSSEEIIPVRAPITIIERDQRLAPSTFSA